MDTDGLRLFVLAAEKLNISAAGRQLGLAPAVASARLAKLERELGADLLHRSTRKVSLSTEGAEFLPYAREMLAQEKDARAALGIDRAAPSGRLRFTAPSTFAQLYIAPILPGFLERYPEISLEMRLSDMQYDLIEGSFDLALRNAAVADSSLKGRKLAEDRRILCAAPAYLQAHGTPAHPSDLAGHRLIAFGDGSPRELIGPDGERAPFNPGGDRCRLNLDDGLSQKLTTMAGAGISINSRWSVQQQLSDGSLTHVLPGWEVNDDTALWLLYPKSNVLTAKVRVFMDFLLARVGGWT